MIKLKNKLGIIVDALGIGIHEGLVKAKEMGVDGVQIWAVSGEMDPANLSKTARRELKGEIESIGLEISALCGDLGGHGFQDKAENPQKLEKSKRIVELAKDLGANIVTTHIGVVPQDSAGAIYHEMWQACEELSQFAKSMDAYFAIETGPEEALHLKGFLDTLSSKHVAVNLDPANFIMVTGDDPAKAVYALKDYIVHTHVKDGIRYQEVDPREIYGSVGYEPMDHGKIAQMVTAGKVFEELPLGQGKVDFDQYFKALQDIGYEGYLTIEREAGSQPVKDITAAIKFVNRYR